MGAPAILVDYDYFKTCWLARPAPGCFVLSKMDFYRAQLGQNNSNDKDNDQQDVSSLAFFAKHRLVNRLFKIRTFRLIDF